MDNRTFEELADREDAVPAYALRRRPAASWVMGRSARWHDPDVLAELRMGELARKYRDITMLGVGAGFGSPGALFRGIRRGMRAFRRLPRR